MNDEQLFHLDHILQTLFITPLDRISCNQLATVCLKIADECLQLMERQGHRICETGLKSERKGLAADCIADLFTTDATGILIYFRRFFLARQHDASSPTDRLILLRRLVSHRIRQHLTRLYAQRDPEGARLLRHIHMAARRNNALSLTKDVTGEYVCLKVTAADMIRRPASPLIRQVFMNSHSARASIEHNILTVLSELSNLCQATVEVSTSELQQLFKTVRHSESRNVPAHAEINPLISRDELELAQAVSECIVNINNTQLSNYIANDKLTLLQALAIRHALDDIASDALAGEPLQDHYEYLSRYWPELSRDHYFTEVRKIFEYIIRIFKNDIRNIVHSRSE